MKDKIKIKIFYKKIVGEWKELNFDGKNGVNQLKKIKLSYVFKVKIKLKEI